MFLRLMLVFLIRDLLSILDRFNKSHLRELHPMVKIDFSRMIPTVPIKECKSSCIKRVTPTTKVLTRTGSLRVIRVNLIQTLHQMPLRDLKDQAPNQIEEPNSIQLRIKS